MLLLLGGVALLVIGVFWGLAHVGMNTCDRCSLQQIADQVALTGATEWAQRTEQADARVWVVSAARHTAELARIRHDNDACDGGGSSVLVFLGPEGSGKCRDRTVPDARVVTVVICTDGRSVLTGLQRACASAAVGTGRPYLIE